MGGKLEREIRKVLKEKERVRMEMVRKERETEIIRKKEEKMEKVKKVEKVEKEEKEEKEGKETKEERAHVVKTACQNRHITDYGALIYQWNRFWSSVLRTRSKIKSEHFVVVLYISFLK